MLFQVKIWFQNRRARERRDREAAQRGQIVQNKQSSSMYSGLLWPFSTQMKQAAHQQTFSYSPSTSSSYQETQLK